LWDELEKHLPSFESAVLTALDAEGYPYSVRCRPLPDRTSRVLEVRLPAGVPLRPGPASLLCHRHDENLWNLKSFLVRGVLARDGEDWSFLPERLVPGAGIGGPMSMVRFVAGARRRTRSYLKKRGLSRPRVPWAEIQKAKAQARELRTRTGFDTADLP
jgi:hypothetical protein